METRESGGEGRPGGLTELFRLRGWEWWLNKIGIGLLLFGLAFLFKFSVDQGWLSPEVRVGFGLAVGASLIVTGLRVYEERRAFSQVLLGGGIGAFYTTGFAAYTLYALVPHVLGFVFMVATTSLAFAFSIRQDQAALSMIGAAGGFGTPFLLYTETGSTGDLALYAILLLLGTVAMYCYKGWRPLLLISTAGTWAVLLIGYWNAGGLGVEITEPDTIALQLGVVAAFLVPWLGSLMREALRPDEAESLAGGISSRTPISSRAPAHLLAVSSPLLLVAFTAEIWSLTSDAAGWIATALAAVYVLAYAILRRLKLGELAYTHALTALLLGTVAITLLLEGATLFVALAVEAALLHAVARRTSDRIVAIQAHTIFVVVGFWFIGHLVYVTWDSVFASADERALLNVRTLADLVTLWAVVASSLVFSSRRISSAYRIAAHAGLLALIWREFSLLPDGAAYVTLVWGAYAVVLIVAGFRSGHALPGRLGLVTLFLVVGKLFLVDLVWVGAVWRILLFLGFGGLFLVLSYYLQALWRPGTLDREEGDGPADVRKKGRVRVRS